MKVCLYLSVLCNKLVLSAWCAYIQVLPPISLYALIKRYALKIDHTVSFFTLFPPVLHEAICTGNAALVGMVLAVRDRQESNDRAKDIPLLLERLESSPDFYIEMTWEFTSWSKRISYYYYYY